MKMAEQQQMERGESRSWQEVQIRKSNNQTEQFNPDKIRRSIQNAGGSSQLADEITQSIQSSTHTQMTTSEIDSRVQEVLRQKDTNAYNNWMQWKQQPQQQYGFAEIVHHRVSRMHKVPDSAGRRPARLPGPTPGETARNSHERIRDGRAPVTEKVRQHEPFLAFL